MNMYDFAAKMEHDAEALYREIASKAAMTGVKRIFTMLADDEKMHAKAIEILRKKSGTQKLNENFIPEVTTVFEGLRKNINNLKISENELEDYKTALEIEKKGLEYYREQLGQMNDDEALHLLKNISNQELYHIKTIENLIDMLERPNWWVENAEFTPRPSDYL